MPNHSSSSVIQYKLSQHPEVYSSGVGRLYAEDLIVKIEGAAGTMIVSA
jgi:hypothetical protein